MVDTERYTVIGRRLLLGACLLWASLPVESRARGTSAELDCRLQLRELALAIRDYRDTYKGYPPPYVADANGRPIHSWRVLILPFLGYSALYERYRFDEPWDGPNNRKLVDAMPQVYRCPDEGTAGGSGMTRYMAVVGSNSMWPPSVDRYSTIEADGVTLRLSGRKEKDVTDGLENTLLLVESPGNLVNWMDPRDLTLDELAALVAPDGPARHRPPHRTYRSFGFRYRTGWSVVFANENKSMLVRDTVPRQLLSALVTVNGREPLPELYDAMKPSWRFNTEKTPDALYWAFLASFWAFALCAVARNAVRSIFKSDRQGTKSL